MLADRPYASPEDLARYSFLSLPFYLIFCATRVSLIQINVVSCAGAHGPVIGGAL
jgi:hypothetical protein